MLAYAPRPAGRSGSPRTLALVAAGHVVALALVLTARSEYVARDKGVIPDVVFIDPLKPPPPPPPEPQPAPPRAPTNSTLDRPTVIVPTPPVPSDPIADSPTIPTTDRVIGNTIDPTPPLPMPPIPQPLVIRKAPRFATPADLVRPPYPLAKQRTEEEAALRLSLAIDPRGRVTAVDPVGAADPIFLAAARRHILRYWRYTPATEGGQAVAANIVITLRFEIER